MNERNSISSTTVMSNKIVVDHSGRCQDMRLRKKAVGRDFRRSFARGVSQETFATTNFFLQ
jgi:hypothetical protein